MRPIAPAVACSVVCLCVNWSNGCVLQKLLNRSRCHLQAESGGPKEPRISWRSRYPTGRNSFGGSSGPELSAAVYAAKGIVQSTITARDMRCDLSSKNV